MADRSYTSRRELEEHSFHPAITVLVPVAAILLQVMLPRLVPWLVILDLPLVITIFFAVSRRSPIAGTLTGAVVGLLQDALTGGPIGVNGIAKALIGYIAASIGVRVDVENLTTRVLMNFVFSLLQSVILYVIGSRLLGAVGLHVLWRHELLRALVNAAVAIPVFLVLDSAKRTE